MAGQGAASHLGFGSMQGALQLFNQSDICVHVNAASVRSPLRSQVVLQIIRPADAVRAQVKHRDDL